MSSFDAKKAQAEKLKAQQKEAKARAKQKKEAEKQKRQKQRLLDMAAKSTAGQIAKKERELAALASLSPQELEAEERRAKEAQQLIEKLRLEKEEESEKRKERERKMAADQGKDSLFEVKVKTKKGGGKKTTKIDKVNAEKASLEAELASAQVIAARARREIGAYKGQLECRSFTLPNPGGGANLIEDAFCILVRGHRYGLIGRNGKGKSTMLRAFASRRVGNIPKNVSVHYVSQDVQLNETTKDMTPAQVVVDADVERKMLMEEVRELEDKAERGAYTGEDEKRHSRCVELLELIQADSAERRAEDLIVNLGFSTSLRSRKLSELSGGWRVRTMLAAAIFARPDVLLLDEPTNHLSIRAVLWLARELATNPVWKERIVVIVSHDRAFLDEVCSDCLHISGAAKRLTQARGNYSTWSKRRGEARALYEKEAKLIEARLAKLNDISDCGFRYGGSSSAIGKKKQAEKQGDKLAEEAKEKEHEAADLMEDNELPLVLKSGGELSGFVVNLKDVGFGYPGQPLLFQGCEFGITSSSRIVLLGENGNGKTTLVKLIMGELEPTIGQVVISPKARVALVNQHHAEQIDLTKTPLEYMQDLFKAKEGVSGYDHLQGLRSHLASCGVTSGGDSKREGDVVLEMQSTPAGALSGGQRSRVAMAAVSYREPHILVLDEPTNNLDLESVAALAESVKAFKGAVVCVSHDQYFVEQISNEAWIVGGKQKVVKRVESFKIYKDAQMRSLDKKEDDTKGEDVDVITAPLEAKMNFGSEPVPEPQQEMQPVKDEGGGISINSSTMAKKVVKKGPGKKKKPMSLMAMAGKKTKPKPKVAPKPLNMKTGRWEALM
ncbi:hypothetical protein TrCOL_g2043 [Triparma columacea]|uniref:ABC transporter domain-containing protein n=1 Tax=Triparma columacea TaxID=722753 RepID=A0A9W7LFN6_9STRA|nr:hypothetical protein TrCOL_g2043 [Triparma columacea]